MQKITDNLAAMKVIFYGDGESEPKKETVDKLTEAIFESDILLTLIQRIVLLEFEARKDLLHVYTYLFRNNRDDAVTFVTRHPDILSTLIQGYGEGNIALTCGAILRETLRSESLCLMLLSSPPLLDQLFSLLQVSIFDVALDAFATFTALLTKHKRLVCKYLDDNFDSFFAKYQKLLNSSEYVTCRLSLKLLATLLLSRENFTIMMRFIAIPEHLIATMRLLRASSKATQVLITPYISAKSEHMSTIILYITYLFINNVTIDVLLLFLLILVLKCFCCFYNFFPLTFRSRRSTCSRSLLRTPRRPRRSRRSCTATRTS